MDRRPPTAIDQIDALAIVVDLVRRGRARTRPELAGASLLGRTLISQRLEEAVDLGLLDWGGTGPSSGGRAPRTLRFRSESGVVLTAVLGAASMHIAATDLSGEILGHVHREWQVASGPESTLKQIAKEFEALLDVWGAERLWGIALGIPAPVDFATGRPVLPPIMPGWDGFGIREWFAGRFPVPVWVDNEVNLMTLGEAGAGRPPVEGDMIFVKVATGIGAGLVTRGRLHRGSRGAAGDIGHVRVVDDRSVICRCGQIGCLEAVAGGWALVRDALTAVHEGRSPHLADVYERNGRITPADIGQGTLIGDPSCVAMTARAAEHIGDVLATLVSFYNPDMVVIGGGAARTGDMFMAALERAIRGRALSLATRDLAIRFSSLDEREAVVGGTHLVVDALLSADALALWAPHGSPRCADPRLQNVTA